MSDAAAIRASLSNPHAFGAVFDRHYDSVYRFVRRRVGETLADDVVSETFVRAFDARERYDTRRPNALPWLLGIAVNLLSHHYRSEERRLRAYAKTGVDAEWDATDAADARLDATATRRRLAAALAALRPDERDVLLLHAWGDLDYAGIAEALAVPTGTVRSRLSRARERVRQLLTTEPDSIETR